MLNRRSIYDANFLSSHRPDTHVAATGASGAIFTRALLLATERDPRIGTVNFIASDNALRVFAEELGIKGRSDLVQQLIGHKAGKDSSAEY